MKKASLFPNEPRRKFLRNTGIIASGAVFSPLLHANRESGFTHSVASGDPTQDSVTLWARYVHADAGQRELKVQIAREPEFKNIVSSGQAIASSLNDFCVHYRSSGLDAGQWYWYRFVTADGQYSDTGRTRTLPAGSIDKFRIAVFSCANATSGWFNAYGHAAARDDLDLLVHLGDYIYESTLSRSDALAELAMVRDIQPSHETVSLQDYRLRYASYRRDVHLQALHRAYPMIAMCDDHETVNNSWQHGAKNHGADEGDWNVRKRAAMQAWHEWMPMRDKAYTQYELGDLATLFRLETRILARSRQLELKDWLKAHPGDPLGAARAFRDGPLQDSSRTMLGTEQERWLAAGLSRSTARGKKWQILAQQVIMGTTLMPWDWQSWFRQDAPPSAKKRAELEFAVQLGELGIPTSMDRWDGYPAARTRLLDAVQAADAHLVVFSGDSHNAWAFELENRGRPAGVEFACHGVSSLGMDKRYFGDPPAIARSYRERNTNIRWCDTSQRGYMVTEIRPDTVTNEWLFLHSRHRRSLQVLGSHRMQFARTQSRLTSL